MAKTVEDFSHWIGRITKNGQRVVSSIMEIDDSDGTTLLKMFDNKEGKYLTRWYSQSEGRPLLGGPDFSIILPNNKEPSDMTDLPYVVIPGKNEDGSYPYFRVQTEALARKEAEEMAASNPGVEFIIAKVIASCTGSGVVWSDKKEDRREKTVDDFVHWVGCKTRDGSRTVIYITGIDNEDGTVLLKMIENKTGYTFNRWYYQADGSYIAWNRHFDLDISLACG